MASLSDENLEKLISMMNTDKLAGMLRKAGLPVAKGLSRDKLARRLFIAIRMGLPILPPTEERDKIVMASKAKKFSLEGSVVTDIICLFKINFDTILAKYI